MTQPDRAASPAARLGLLAALCLTSFVVSLALFAPALRNGWVYDDHRIVEQNPLVRELSPIRALTSNYWAPYRNRGLYRPATILTFALNHRFSGESPAGYHGVNVLLHGLCAASVCALGWLLTRNPVVSLVSGLVFAAHPVHIEAVSPVVGRSELLAALSGFGVLALALSVLNRDPRPEGKRNALFLGVVSGGLMLLGLLSKESAIGGLLVLLMVCAFHPGNGAAPRSLLSRLRSRMCIWMPALMAFGVWMGLRWNAIRVFLVHPERPSALANPIAHAGFFEGRAASVSVLGRYARLLLWPNTFSPDYSYAQIVPSDELFSLFFWIGALALGGVAVGMVLWRKTPRVWVPLVLLGFGLLPTSNLLFPIGTIMAERLLYFPSGGFAILLALVLAQGVPRIVPGSRGAKAAVVCAAALGTALLAAVTVGRIPVWRSDEVLFAHAAERSPLSALVHYNRGCLFLSREDLPRAEASFRTCRSIYPDYPGAAENLGLVQFRLGDLDAAYDTLKEAVGRNAASREARVTLASVCVSLGNREMRDGSQARAEAFYREAAGLDIAVPEAWLNLASLQAAQGRTEAAIESLALAGELAGDDPALLQRTGSLLIDLGRKQQAAAILVRALAVDPGSLTTLAALGVSLVRCGRADAAIAPLERVLEADPDAPAALNNLAWALASAGRDLERSVELARKAVALRPRAASLHDTLAGSLDAAGKCREARAAAGRAVELQREHAPQSDEGIEQSLEILKRGCP